MALLAVVIDLSSRRIVGWALADHLRSELVVEAMKQAITSRRHTTGLIFHSDRGSQYGSRAFRDVLRLAGMRQSMSARANPYHNAWTKSFMGTLKAEMLQNGRFINATDAHAEIFAFIDGYCNTQRLHSSLHYRTPSHFEADLALANQTSFGPIIRGISITQNETFFAAVAFFEFDSDSPMVETIAKGTSYPSSRFSAAT
jgi:transposase InsO family protein